MRRSDIVRMICVFAGLIQLIVTGVLSAQAPVRHVPLSPAQEVVNQQQADRVDEVARRLDRLDLRIEALRIGERLVVLEDLKGDVAQVRNTQLAIFTALAMNLVATLIQIRTQWGRRRPELADS